jgi:ATP-dependent protease ClpP protease subunit
MFKLEKLTDKAVLTIYGYVGGMFLDFRAVNAALEDISKSGYSKLDFHIHTYGGDVFNGNLICNFLDAFKGDIDMFVDGVAASMGSIIVRSATRIHMAKNGFQMIHAPQGGANGTAKQMEQTAHLLTLMEVNFKDKLMETGMTEDKVNELMDGTDYWFGAEECVKLGLATDVFDPKVKTTTLDKSEAMQIGAEATFHRFAALLVDPETNNNKNKTEMNKEDLIKRYGLTIVTAQSTDEEVLAAVDAKVNAGTTALQAAENERKATHKKAVATAVDAKIEAKVLTKELREKYLVIGEKLSIDEFNAMLNDLKPYEPIATHITGKKDSATTEDRKGWTWDDYQTKAKAELEAMPKVDSETFKALYKAKYGSEPEL